MKKLSAAIAAAVPVALALASGRREQLELRERRTSAALLRRRARRHPAASAASAERIPQALQHHLRFSAAGGIRRRGLAPGEAEPQEAFLLRAAPPRGAAADEEGFEPRCPCEHAGFQIAPDVISEASEPTLQTPRE